MRTLKGITVILVLVCGRLISAAVPLPVNDQAGFVFHSADGDIVAFVDRTGQFMIRSGAPELNDAFWQSFDPEESQDLRSFRDGVAPVQENGKWGFINDDSVMEINPIYEATRGFGHKIQAPFGMAGGAFAAVKKDGVWTFIDHGGKEMTHERFEDASAFRLQFARVKRDGKWGFMDISFKLAIPPAYEDVGFFSGGVTRFNSGVAPVKSGGLWGLIDKHGRFVAEPKYQDIGIVRDGRVAVNLNGKWGFIDSAGKPQGEAMFEEVWPHKDGFAAAKANGKWGYVGGSSSAWRIQPQFEEAWPFHDHRAPVKLNGKWGFIDTGGKIRIQPEYDRVWPFSLGYAAVKKANVWYYVNDNGKVLYPPAKRYLHK